MAKRPRRAPDTGGRRSPPRVPDGETDPPESHAAIREQPLLEDESFHLVVSPDLALQLERIRELLPRLDVESLKELMSGSPPAAPSDAVPASGATARAAPSVCELCAMEKEALGLPGSMSLRCTHRGKGH